MGYAGVYCVEALRTLKYSFFLFICMFEHFLYSAGTEILAHLLGYYVATIENPHIKYNWCYAKCGIISLLLSAILFVWINPNWPMEAALMWGLGFNKFLRCGIRWAKAKDVFGIH